MKMSTTVLVLLGVVLASVLFSVRGVTVDQYEILVREPPSQHAGDSYDLFGYTAVLHNRIDPSVAGTPFSDIVNGARILIGVPNGTTIGVNRVEGTGYVAQCTVSSASTSCEPMTGTSGNDALLYDTTHNENYEDKSGQFLGISMDSRNGQFAVCGHKWKYRGSAQGSNRYVHGQCLVAGRSLTNFKLLRPCTPRGTHNLFVGSNAGAGGFAYCSSGTDISFTEGGSLIMGAPGSYLWKGAGFVFDGTNERIPVTTDSGSSFGYIGMGTTQARIRSSSVLEWVMGSPRASNYLGQVLVYSFDFVEPVTNEFEFSQPSITLTGTQVGSYYGYTLAGVDFNGDGFDDLVVGAPLYFKGSSLPEVGAVYIYENQVTSGSGTLARNAFFILEPPNGGVAYGRFGHAVEPLGDLNADGFQDVAISAPFGEGQSGTVFIYVGSLQGIVRTPAQTIVGSQLNLMSNILANLTSFGASLSGTTDIDGNGYNDLAIGAFESRKVFVMRSRSVATISVSVTPSSISVPIKATKSCEFDSTPNDCFAVDYCLAVSGEGFIAGQNIPVNYTLYADQRLSGLQARGQFAVDSSSVFSSQAMLPVGGSPTCYNYTVYILSTSTVDDLINTPLRPSIEVFIPQGTPPGEGDGNPTVSDLRMTRIFSKVTGTTSASVQGARECGGGGSVCTADMALSDFSISYISRSNENYTGSVLLVGVVTDLVFTASLHNNGPDPAYSSSIVFTHPSSLTFSRVESGSQLTCLTESTETTCTISGVRGQNSTLAVSVRFVVLSGTVSGNEGTLSVTIASQIAGNDPTPANNEYTYSITVQASVSPAVTGSISNDQLTILQNYSRAGVPTSITQLGRQVRIIFTATNGGPSSIGQGRLTIRIPTRNSCTKNAFLFYLASVTASTLGGSCTPDPLNSYDILGLLTSESPDDSNTTTAPSPKELPDIPGNCPGDPRVSARCSAGTPGCVTLTCGINAQRRGSSGQVSIVGYVDEAYLKSAGVEYTLFFGAEYEVLDENFSEDNPNDNKDEVSLQLNGDARPPIQEPVEIWVIIVPIVVAVVFIVILVIILWVCGFFKRRQKWKTQEETTEGENEGQNGTAETVPKKTTEEDNM